MPLSDNQRNIRRALEMLGVRVSYDEFNDLMLIEDSSSRRIVDDAAMSKLWLLVEEQYRVKSSRDFFFTVVEEAARRNTFHPVRDYLAGLTWDGVARIDTWLITYGGAKDTEYVRAIGALILMAAVRRVRQPGVKFDEMPVLEGPQGIDKSTLIKVLAVRENWFSDDLPLNADGKRVIEQTRGRWIIEAADMSGIKRAAIEHLKAMLSRQVDRARMAWGRITANQPRQFVVFGTTNDNSYLKDTTGNRRFWPIAVTKVDINALKRDLDQLWAEAGEREAKGESIRLDPKLWGEAADEQAERTIDDPWLEVLSDAIGDINGKILSDDAWLIVGVRAEHRSQDQNKRLGSAMRTLGFERPKGKLRFDGKKQWGYVRGTTEEREQRIHCFQEGMGRGDYTCSHKTWQEQQKADLENTASNAAMRKVLRGEG